jgi:glyoxylase-like metal-dependent hydrolase (beta-lactamase superfamily II)
MHWGVKNDNYKGITMSVTIERFAVGPLETNAYLVIDEEKKDALIFDPSQGCGQLLSRLRQLSITPSALVLTHAHFDHIMGVEEICTAYADIAVYIHPDEESLLRDPQLNGSLMIGGSYNYEGPVSYVDESTTTIGSFSVKVLHVPGHSPGGCAFVFNNGECVCGDVLFANSVGRADLPGGNMDQLIGAIKAKLMSLPDTTVIWPGHMGRTTIGRERRLNPFLH